MQLGYITHNLMWMTVCRQHANRQQHNPWKFSPFHKSPELHKIIEIC